MEQQLSLFSDLDNARTLLLSLQPQYWRLIIAKEKKYEYRRKFPKYPVSAFIYASSPQKELVGKVEFGDPIIDQSKKIAKFADDCSPGSFGGVFEYLKGLEYGYAVPILSYCTVEPTSLSMLRKTFPDFRPPQSYLVLDNYKEILSFFNRLEMSEPYSFHHSQL